MKKILVISLLLFSASAFAVDTDGDGVDDSMDAFPNNPEATTDTDGDGMPDVINLNNLPVIFADSFESGNFTAGGWSVLGSASVYSVGGIYGYVAKFGYSGLDFGCMSPSSRHIQKTVTVPAGGGHVQFRVRAQESSLAWGPGRFYVDGSLVKTWANYNMPWTSEDIALSAGAHVLRWQIGCGGSDGGGYLLVDDVKVTAHSSLIEDTDDDNDLMPDTWETTYGLNPLVNDANLDADNDGLTNLQEYNNGSNPIVARTKNDYNADSVAGWIWKGVSSGNETASQNWQLTFPLYSPNWAVPNRFYHPVFPDQLNWEIVTSGDFNEDGDADILWRNTSTAEWKVWQMQNGLRAAQNSPADFDLEHAWQVIGAGDTDKDGDDDVLLNNSTTGEVLIWQMQDHAIANTHVVGTKAGYSLNRIGDFNKDGDIDLLFRENGTDALITWEIEANGFATERTLANTGTNYNPVCAGDFDKDGDDDIMLINSSTMQEKWFVMESFARSQVFGSTNSGFVFRGCGDYDGDGDADILWQRLSDDANRVILQQNYGASKQTVYTNAFGAVSGFVYRGNSN